MSNGDYSEMIELPVSTCEMVVAPKKKRRIFESRLIKAVNKKTLKKQTDKPAQTVSSYEETRPEPVASDVRENFTDMEKPVESKVKRAVEKQKKPFKFDLVVAEVIAVFVLIVAILLTNIFWEDSGINTMIKSVFGAKTETIVDARTAKDLAVSAPSTANVTIDGGVMTFSSAASVYPPANGKVSSVAFVDGTYTMTIKHSDVFKTVISGADAVYVKEGDSVYGNIPVAYAAEGTSVAMYDNGTLAADYMLDNGKIVWQS